MFKLIAFCLAILIIIIWLNGYKKGQEIYTVYSPGKIEIPIKRTLKPAI